MFTKSFTSSVSFVSLWTTFETFRVLSSANQLCLFSSISIAVPCCLFFSVSALKLSTAASLLEMNETNQVQLSQVII